jgi:ankyrin repeat protein
LHKCAAEEGTQELCLELIAAGISPRAQDCQGNSPLHVAARSGNVEVAKALCKGGADIVGRNKSNRTPKMMVRSCKLYLKAPLLYNEPHNHDVGLEEGTEMNGEKNLQ